jgi:hypothetical protein
MERARALLRSLAAAGHQLIHHEPNKQTIVAFYFFSRALARLVAFISLDRFHSRLTNHY